MAGGEDKFEVLSVPDAGTLKLRWVRAPHVDYYDPEPTVKLVGVWSDPKQEPQSAYIQRLSFLKKSLIGKIVVVPTQLETVRLNPKDSEGPQVHYGVFLENPTNVLLENGTNLNEVLLKEGYAIVDERLSSGLKPSELIRYQADEKEAREHRLGIWANEPSAYSMAKQSIEKQRQQQLNEEANYWEGFGFFVAIQGLLAGSILWLAYLLRRDPQAVGASLVLLVLPVGFLMPDLIHSSNSPLNIRFWPYHSAESVGIAFLLMVSATIPFVRLLITGPADQWGARSLGIRGARSIMLFFAGLWLLIVVFALFYIQGIAESWIALIRYSTSIALSVPSPLVSQSTSTITLFEKISVMVWLGFCAAAIRPRNKLASGSLPWNAAATAASIVIMALAVSSAFALLFFADFEENAFIQAINRRDCFWFSLATLFRQSYTSVPLSVPGIWLGQCVEAHIALFLALLGFRVIYALPIGVSGK